MRCFVQPAEWNRSEIVLDREETHHLLQVLRAAPGDRVAVFDGEGAVGWALVVHADKSGAVLRLVERRIEPPDAAPILLAQALLREQKMDFVLQKAVELGVAAIQPLIAERCVARVKPDQAKDKVERWRKIALHAAKQCGAPRLPIIHPPVTVQDWLTPEHLTIPALVGALTDGARPLADTLHQVWTPNVTGLSMLIGPEGDFSPAEMDNLVRAGVHPVTFGRLVLRAETAALFALSILRHTLDSRAI